jgi:hypothetical protein
MLGIPYAEAKALFPYGPSSEGYYASTTAHKLLKERGWRPEYRTPRKPADGPWPPAPFAPVHMATVLVSRTSPCWHSVVMSQDGLVLDPQTPEPRALTDYVEVQAVVGFTPAVDPVRSVTVTFSSGRSERVE